MSETAINAPDATFRNLEVLGDANLIGTAEGNFAGGGGGGVVLSTGKISLTNAQILGLGTTPVLIIAAPGDGKVAVPTFIVWELVYGSVPFTIAADPPYLVWRADGSGPAANAVWYSIGDTVSEITPVGVQWYDALTSGVENEPIVLTSDGAITDGDSTGAVTVFYVIIEL